MKAAEAGEAEEVFDVVLPSGDEAVVVVQPGEEPFDLPAAVIATQGSPVLGAAATAAIGGDHCDAVGLGGLAVELVRVVGFVADEAGGPAVKEASCQNVLHKLAFGRRSAVDSNGERKTVTSGDNDDFAALAAPARPRSPFLALAKVASTNASSRFSWSRSCNRLPRRRSAASNLPLRTRC